MSQTQIHAQKAAQTTTDDLEPGPEPVSQPEAQKLSSATEDLLDEIDAVLEADAEEFVAQYIQKGGQ